MNDIKKYIKNDPILKERRRDLRRNQTEAEKALWARLRNRQLNDMRFMRQYSIGCYILDFYCPAKRLAIELDGGQHNDEETKGYDAARTEYLRAQGINVIRFWNNEVLQNLQGVLTKLMLQIKTCRVDMEASGCDTRE